VPQPQKPPRSKHPGWSEQAIPDRHEMLRRARELLRSTKVERKAHLEQGKMALAHARIA
jgi:hypothetical protein